MKQIFSLLKHELCILTMSHKGLMYQIFYKTIFFDDFNDCYSHWWLQHPVSLGNNYCNQIKFKWWHFWFSAFDNLIYLIKYADFIFVYLF